MMTSTDRFERSLIRNLNEVGAAIFERRALVGIEKASSAHAWDFFRVAHNAMFNDMMAHCMRALDRNGQSASFWYLYRCQRKAIDQFVTQRGIDWSLIEAVTDKLKQVRDKTHFHIDRDAVSSPRSIWRAADIKGSELAKCMDGVWEVLQFLHEQHLGEPFDAPVYDGADATQIVKAA